MIYSCLAASPLMFCRRCSWCHLQISTLGGKREAIVRKTTMDRMMQEWEAQRSWRETTRCKFHRDGDVSVNGGDGEAARQHSFADEGQWWRWMGSGKIILWEETHMFFKLKFLIYTIQTNLRADNYSYHSHITYPFSLDICIYIYIYNIML